jgi:hypothetical protein
MGTLSDVRKRVEAKVQAQIRGKQFEEQESYYDRLLDLYTGQLEEEKAGRAEFREIGAPFRETAAEAAGLLREDIGRAPGESPLYQRALTKGLEDLSAYYSKLGLLDSGEMQTAAGEFTGELMGREISGIRRGREAILPYGTTGVTAPLPVSRPRIGELPQAPSRWGPVGETYATMPQGTKSGLYGQPLNLSQLPMQYLRARSMFGEGGNYGR